MDSEKIKNLIESHLTDTQIRVTGDGHHFEAVVISPAFEGKNAVKRQQLVYAALQESIASGELHAISFKTLTPEEAKE